MSILMKEKQQENDSTKKMLELLNQVPVTKEDIIEVVEELELADPDDHGWEKGLITVIRLQNGNREKVQAIMFRMEALARLLENEDTSGWTLRLPNGAVLTQEPILAAAAVEKLIDKESDVGFGRESFLNKVLELAELDIVG